MKVIDTFMFSEPYEKDLLLLKLELENDVVDEWFITEGAYTFQGEHKGHYIRDILNKDERFQVYNHKIKLFEIDVNFNRISVVSG